MKNGYCGVDHVLVWKKGREWPCDAGSPSEPLSCDFSGIVIEGFTIPEIVF